MGTGQNTTRAAFTQQGFKVELDDSGRWSHLLIASQAGGATFSFGLTIKDFLVQDALAQGSTFAIVRREKRATGNPLFVLDGTIKIGDWTFKCEFPTPGKSEKPESDLSLSTTGLPDPVLVFKYSRFGSMKELLDNPQTWAAKEIFLGDPDEWDAVARQLKALISEAKALRHDRGALYEPFARRMTDPNWNGVLAVNLTPIVGALPAQINGLMGGIKRSQLRVHHVGIDPGAPDGEDKLFGLIDYDGGQIGPIPANKKNHFHVEYLRVLFEGSQITYFDCRVQVELDELFADAIALQGEDRNIIAFDGHYECRIENGRKIEAYSFYHEGHRVSDFSDTEIFKTAEQIFRRHRADVG
jgi:hypothetical protein